jgi:hypothetical protein
MIALEFARHITGAKPRQNSPWWDGRCPAHDDRRASLSWCDGDRGLIVKCHASCALEAIARGAHVGIADLFLVAPQGSNWTARTVTYDYTDAVGALRYQVVRFEPKDFRCRRPDGAGGWIWNLQGIAPLLYRLRSLPGARRAWVAEGERDADTLAAAGLTATTNHGGAGKWRGEHTAALVAAAVPEVIALRDNDRAGAAHQAEVVRACVAAGLRVKRVELSGLPPLRDKHGEDVTDWLALGHTVAELEALAEAAPVITASARVVTGVWASAIALPDFLQQADDVVAFLEPHLLVRGAITEVFAPRGLGKTQVAYAVGLRLSRAGCRVLLVDRDNPRHEIKRRLRMWGGRDAESFKLITRDKAPALTDAEAWSAFPLDTYDVVIVDSIDASTEGVGEGDSAKPSLAFAAVLDLARRADGPAIMVLGNVIKSGAHSRGSGVLEDRADIVYEVRDATELTPCGTKDWWHELPAASVGDWAQRATRRKRRDFYRLAFIASKFRLGEEPEPFVLEVDHRTEPWTLRDATEDIVQAGQEALRAAASEREAVTVRAREQLLSEMRRRVEAGEGPMIRGEAEALAQAAGLTRRDARGLLADGDGRLWRLSPGLRGGPGKKGPAIFVVSRSEIPCEVSRGERAKDERSPRQTTFPEVPSSADRMNTGRRKVEPTEPAIHAPSGEVDVSPPPPEIPESATDGETSNAAQLPREWTE